MMFSIRKKDDLEDVDKKSELQSEKDVRLLDKIGRQGFYYGAESLFDVDAENVKKAGKKFLNVSRTTTGAVEDLNEDFN